MILIFTGRSWEVPGGPGEDAARAGQGAPGAKRMRKFIPPPPATNRHRGLLLRSSQ